MTRAVLVSRLRALLHAVGPSELLAGLVQTMNEDLAAVAPSGTAPDQIDELAAWGDWLDGPLDEALSDARDLEDDAGYPPADVRASPKQQGRGGFLKHLFPWMPE